MVMSPYIHQFADFLRLHLNSISVGVVSTLLIIYGAPINAYFKTITKSMPFVARFLLFFMLCGAGYAFVTSQSVRMLYQFLSKLADWQLICCVISSFVILAFLAKAGKDV